MNIEELLEKHGKSTEEFKPITVEKHLELELDVGALLATDKNDLDTKLLKEQGEQYLLDLARDNTQLLYNKIWTLPIERLEDVIVAKLPAPIFVLPRHRPIPKPKPLTKWQEFAQEKGIRKKRKAKLAWDDQLKKWIPNYGYKRADALKEKNWLLEVPQNADPMEDQFEKLAKSKSERVSKNEFQRLRNIAKAKNVKVPRLGLTAVDKSSSKDLSNALTVAKASTASIGKFQQKLPKEKEARGISAIVPGSTRKRKPPPVAGKIEKSQNLSIIDNILNKKPKLDIDKAVARHINEEKIQHSEERKGKPKAGRGGKKRGNLPKGRSSGKRPGAKPPAGKGKRNPSKRTVGRKRR